MSEVSGKSSTKKGFTAPVLKKVVSKGQDINNEQQKKQKNKVVQSTLTEDTDVKSKKETNSSKESEKKLPPKAGRVSKNEEKIKKVGQSKTTEDNEVKSKKETVNSKESENKLPPKAGGVSKNEKKIKKPEVSLSDSQYDDIFTAVLQGQRMNSISQQNTPGEEKSQASDKGKENAPTSHIEDKVVPGSSQKSLKRPKPDLEMTPKTPENVAKKLVTKTPPSKRNTLSELSPWGSHFKKQPSQGLAILKELQESQSSLLNSSTLLSPENTDSSGEPSDLEEDVQMSQQSAKQLSQISGYGSQSSQPRQTSKQFTNQRKRLEELQCLRNVGVWVYCCRMSCQKQRYLANVTDPQEVPDIWYCHMNPDPKYNSCNCAEQPVSTEEEEDMIYNEYTAGSLVWARVDGYPWWPAMVDDDPDLEQYYWLADDNSTVTFYHVVFFDEVGVTRAWVTLKNISSYAKNENKFRQRAARGIDFTRRIMVAKEQANDALTLSTAQRLKIYSFIARFTGPISTSAQKVKNTMTKYKLKVNVSKKETNKLINSTKERKNKNMPTQEKPDYKENRKRKREENSTKVNKIDESKEKNKLKKNKLKLGINDKVHANNFSKNGQSVKSIKGENDKFTPIAEDILSQATTVENPKINHKTKQENNLIPRPSNEERRQSDGMVTEETLKNANEEALSEIIKPKNDQKPKEINLNEINFDKKSINEVANPLQASDVSPDSETPSLLVNLSQKSKLSDGLQRDAPPQDTECSTGIIEPSQGVEETKHSQSTIADFFAAESEDAVVPEANGLDLSQPFEE